MVRPDRVGGPIIPSFSVCRGGCVVIVGMGRVCAGVGFAHESCFQLLFQQHLQVGG